MSDPAADPGELTALEQAIAALEGQRRLLGDQVVETALAPLVDKRDRLLAASVGEQRKFVTVLFADLVDSTPLARRLDAEDLQQVMSRYFAAVRGAVEAEGGVVEKFIGDAVDGRVRALPVAGGRRRPRGAGRRWRMVAALEQLSVAGRGRARGAPADAGRHRHRRDGRDRPGRAGRPASSSSSATPPTAPPGCRRRRRPGTVLLSADTTRQVRGVVRAAPDAGACS